MGQKEIFATWAELCNSQYRRRTWKVFFFLHTVWLWAVCTLLSMFAWVRYLFLAFVFLFFFICLIFLCTFLVCSQTAQHRTCLLIFSLVRIKWSMCNLFYDEQCLGIWHTIHRVTQWVHQQKRIAAAAAAASSSSLQCFPFSHFNYKTYKNIHHV